MVGQQSAVSLHRIESAITLDGAVDDVAWARIPALPMTMSGPLYGTRPSQPTTVKVAYDDEFVYVAGVFLQPGSDGGISRSLTRDQWGDGDRFEIIIDGYNDNENAMGFATNPAGVRIDFSVSRDAESGTSSNPAVNTAWDAPWAVETARGAGRWSAEIRIPLSTLRFQPNPSGRVVMGIIVRRYIADANEHVTFPAIPERWAGGHNKPSLAADVSMEGVASERPLYVTPYVVTGHTRQLDPAASATQYLRETRSDIGLDLKYAPADNVVVDLTANTDFAQAEMDDFQVNLTRFDLFVPEKRPFFLERAGVFDFQTEGDDRLFHSRRIGLGSDGATIPILVGGRVVARRSGWDVGLLNMQTAAAGQASSENFGVVRLRRRILNDNSYAGAMVTTRAPRAGSARVAYGADGRLHLGGSDYLAASVSQSIDGGAASPASMAGYVSFERQSRVGLALSQTVSWNGRDYAPPIGFVRRRGILRHESSTEYAFTPDSGSPLLWFGPGLSSVVVVRDRDRSVESMEIAPRWSIQWKSGLWLNLEANLHMEDVREPFPLGQTQIPAGRYWYRSARVFVALPPTWTINSRLYFRYGQFYDGEWTLLIVNPYYQPSEHLQLGLDVQRTAATFPDRAPFRADVLRLRADVAFTRRLSGGMFVQYASTSSSAAVNARLRYNLGEGRDLYLVFNESVDTIDGPPLTFRTESTGLLVKFEYTLPIS